jgi:hypothetical protein
MTAKMTIKSKPTIPTRDGIRPALFRIRISLELGSPFFVFLARDVTSGISPLKELQRRLHLPVGSPPHRHHE